MMATVSIENFGEYGFMPDVSPQQLPPNGFSYSRNYRFDEGRFAMVTNGYTNAIAGRVRTLPDGTEVDASVLGDASTTATFLYSWLLGTTAYSLVYFDSNASKLRYITNNSVDEIVDYDITTRNVFARNLSYLATGTPDNTQFSATASTITIGTGTNQTAIETALTGTGVSIKIYIDGIERLQLPIASNVTNATTSVLTVTGTVDTSLFTAGTEYQVSIQTDFTLSTESAYTWQATDAFGVPIFNNGLEVPYVFNNSQDVGSLSTLTNFPSTARTTFMTKFGGFLFAIGYTDPTGPAGERGSSRSVAISDVIQVPGTLPMWDFSNDESFAQIFDLSLYTDGDLVSAFEANNILYVNSTTDVITFTYDGAGGFNATRLPIGGGVLTMKSSVAIPNGFFNIGSGRIYIHDGNSFNEVGDGVWSDSWYRNVDESRLDEVQVVYNSRSHSVWIKSPVGENTQEMWIYNLNSKTLAVLDDHNEINYMATTAVGLPPISLNWNSLDEDLTWDTLPQTSWNEFPIPAVGEFRDRVISVGNRNIFIHDSGTTFNGREIMGELQREFVKLTDNTYGTYTIYRLIPWIRAVTGTMYSIRVGGASTPGSPTSYTPYKTFTTGTTEKLDFRRNVKWGAFTIRSTTSGSEISGLELDISATDRR